MQTKSRKGSARSWLWAIAVAAIGALALAIVRSERLPSGPVDIVWDREACAHCRMHVSEPRFSAQLQLRTGVILNYDDPGCLLRHLERHPASDVHAVWFHHIDEDRWLDAAHVGFRSVEPTPMGYNLGAIDSTEPGALGLETVRARLRAEPGPVEVH